jgi:hypothetical protein
VVTVTYTGGVISGGDVGRYRGWGTDLAAAGDIYSSLRFVLCACCSVAEAPPESGTRIIMPVLACFC